MLQHKGFRTRRSKKCTISVTYDRRETHSFDRIITADTFFDYITQNLSAATYLDKEMKKQYNNLND